MCNKSGDRTPFRTATRGLEATVCIPQLTLEGEEFPKPVVARFDTPRSSSDGGAVLLKAVDSRLGLTRRLAAYLDDPRQPGKVVHETIGHAGGRLATE